MGLSKDHISKLEGLNLTSVLKRSFRVVKKLSIA